MKKNIFISGTTTNIGKTYTSLALIEALGELGLKVGVMKPIETGVKYIPEDASALFEKAKKFNPRLNELQLEDICPISLTMPAAPEIARNSQPIDFELIEECYARICEVSDIVVVEGAGGLLSPIEGSYFMLNLAEMLNCKIILVAGAKLGCINDIMLNEKLLKYARLEHFIAVNKQADDVDFDQISAPYLKSQIKDLFILPEDMKKLAMRLAA
jgi:dethiobiotin synthetase